MGLITMMKAEMFASHPGHQCWFAQDVMRQVQTDPTHSGHTGLSCQPDGALAAFNSFTQQR